MPTETIRIGTTGSKQYENGTRYWIKEDGSDRFFQTWDGSTGMEFMGKHGAEAIVTYEVEHRVDKQGQPRTNLNITNIATEGQGSLPVSENGGGGLSYDEREAERRISIHRQTAAKCAAQLLTGSPLPAAATAELVMKLTEMLEEYFSTGEWFYDGNRLGFTDPPGVPDEDDGIPFESSARE